jgi:hypothetical protein
LKGFWVFKSITVSLLLILPLHLFANQTIKIDDKNLEYEVKGDGTLTVLFDAGALTGMAGWDSLWDRLPDNITAFRFSRLGEGQSDMCEGQRTNDEHVDEVKSLVNALKIETPFLYVGHSLGGATARNYASTFPDDVLGMLLVDPENPRDIEIINEIDPINGPNEIAAIKKNDYELSDGRWCFLDAIWSKKTAKDHDDIGDIPVTLIATTMKHNNPQMIFNSDVGRKRWGEIQQDWVKTFPQGEFIATSKSGHYIQQSEPQLVLNELSKLIERVERQTKDFDISGRWIHSTKPVIIQFNMESNEAFVFRHDEANSDGLNIIKNITQHKGTDSQWNGEMFDGYQGKYVNVNILKSNNELTVFTEDGTEVLKLLR